jgi:hypothetical protein
MRKVWVLDTSTKGTGASVVPLESTLAKPRRAQNIASNAAKAPPRKREKQRKPRVPRRFRIIDLVSSETLAEYTEMKATLEVLEGVRSPVDVRIFVWDSDADTWQLLRLSEQRALWEAAHRQGTSAVE